MTATGTTGAPVSSARRPTPRLGRPSAPGRMRVPSGKISTMSPRARIARAVAIDSWSDAPRSIGNAPSALSSHETTGWTRRAPSSPRSRSAGAPSRAITNGSRNERWFEAMIAGPVAGMCSRPMRLRRKPDVEERLQHRAHDPVDERAAPRASAPGSAGPPGPCLAIPASSDAVTVVRHREPRCREDRSRSARRRRRGRRVGRPVAARPAGVRRAATSTRSCSARRSRAAAAWRPVGVALHVANGALFGAAYANVAPRCRCPPWARGPAAGLAEHLATWPLTAARRRAPPRARRAARAGRQPARVRPGDVAPPAVRRGARRARAPPEPAAEAEPLSFEPRSRPTATATSSTPWAPPSADGPSVAALKTALRSPHSAGRAGVAQLVEQRSCKAWVVGSSPISGSLARAPGGRAADRV